MTVEEYKKIIIKLLILGIIITALLVVLSLYSVNHGPYYHQKQVTFTKVANVDSLYRKTSNEEIKDTKVLLGFNLLESKSNFNMKELKLIVNKTIVQRYFPLLDVTAWGYDFHIGNSSFFGAIYPHFYKNKLYNLEIELSNNDDNEYDVHASIFQLYKNKYKDWKYINENKSDYWFKDGKMIIIHDDVVNYIVPKIEMQYKQHLKEIKIKQSNKTKSDI